MNPLEELIRTNIEVIGWIASGFILYSFLWDGWKLRLYNGIGALLWLGYGLVEASGSIIFLNGAILLIHLRKLSIEKRRKKSDKKISFERPKKIFKKSTRP